MQQILIIQTAFIGDVILATPVVEKLHQYFPDAKIDFLLRKGNEKLLDNHPHLREVIIWHKKENKRRNLFKIIKKIRNTRYDLVVNLQRFFSTGLITALSKGTARIGFDKNPLSFTFSKQLKHEIGNNQNPQHEVERNLSLIAHLTDNQLIKPKLYPSDKDFETIKFTKPYICIAPTSVWFTKQFPAAKWVELINKIDSKFTIHLLGGPPDKAACEAIKAASKHPHVLNRAGVLSFLESAALMQDANMNYVNDSAPLHIASAMNAPVIAVFCSTVPSFGFTPLSDEARVVEVTEKLDCRPCGLHGFKACPKGHFKCAEIVVDKLLHS